MRDAVAQGYLVALRMITRSPRPFQIANIVDCCSIGVCRKFYREVRYGRHKVVCLLNRLEEADEGARGRWRRMNQDVDLDLMPG